MSDSTLTVSLVSADQSVWEGQASLVVARTSEGEIGIMPQHEPVLAVLDTGIVRITLADGSKVRASADDGFISVENNRVNIVAYNASLES